MNNKSYLFSYLITLAGGILLLVLKDRQDLFTYATILVGILFLVPGLLCLIRAIFPSRAMRMSGEGVSIPLLITASAATIFGLLLVIVPETFVHLMVYAMGLLLICCGVIQIFNFAPGMSRLGFSPWFLTVPVLSAICGVVVIIIGPEKLLNLLALITGIALVVYSLNGLIGYFCRSRLTQNGGPTGGVADIE